VASGDFCLPGFRPAGLLVRRIEWSQPIAWTMLPVPSQRWQGLMEASALSVVFLMGLILREAWSVL
jgi:hypothetical protein